MTVYVDTMQAHFKGMLMCHMIADSEQELHAMAAAIGMQRKSYQGDHYDVPMQMKQLAIQMGARLKSACASWQPWCSWVAQVSPWEILRRRYCECALGSDRT